MQGSLLAMCLLWRARQYRLHIDDFGNPLDETSKTIDSSAGVAEHVPVQTVVADAAEDDIRVEANNASEETPLLRDVPR